MSRFHLWICAWLELFDGIVTILTLTLIRPSLSFKFVLLSGKREAIKRMAKREF